MVLTMNSEEVVDALKAMPAEEMNQGDVYKINIKKRLNTVLVISQPLLQFN